MKTKTVIINGMEVEVKVYPPSRRRAASSVQKPRYQKVDGQRGEKWVAGENGQFKE